MADIAHGRPCDPAETVPVSGQPFNQVLGIARTLATGDVWQRLHAEHVADHR